MDNNKKDYLFAIKVIDKVWEKGNEQFIHAYIFDADTGETLNAVICHHDGKGRFTASDELLFSEDVQAIFCCFPGKVQQHLPAQIADKVMGKWDKVTVCDILHKEIRGNKHVVAHIYPKK